MQPSERESPPAVFATAQSAIARGDWETFFACLDHKALVDDDRDGIDRALKTLPDLAAFTAALARRMRSGGGGGSVSSRGKRRDTGGAVEDIAFMLRR